MKELKVSDSTRATFAIISHPDAGKTTMTEKLLWFGRVIRDVGMVKSKSGQYTKSDWMELEKERGISISSSVMSFHYNKRYLHLLDTPGHQDFSEDTYRTLTAVESVLMMIDSAKGVEAQTRKLMEVCRLRDTPIITFMNKFDRDAMDPFELIDQVEKICSIQCIPMTWPVGDGVEFKGVSDLQNQQILIYKTSFDPDSPHLICAKDLESTELLRHLGQSSRDKLREDLEMVRQLIPEFSHQEYLAGIQTPVYFGSALYNFGVKEALDAVCKYAPGPLPRQAKLAPFDEQAPVRMVSPNENAFTGFIFKIQANMDKKHRDRMTFMRVCSGEFKRGQKVFHVRSKKEIKVASPVIFQAQSRNITEQALPGDIIGVYDSGKYQIGDTFSEGEEIQYTGIPRFAPELFMRIVLKDPLKAKHLEKGLIQLSGEGAIQLFTPLTGGDKILGAVGNLQFEVVRYRLEDEYNVRGEYQSVPYVGLRWPRFDSEQAKNKFEQNNRSYLLMDTKGRLVYAMRSEWDLKLAQEKNPDVHFYQTSEFQDKKTL